MATTVSASIEDVDMTILKWKLYDKTNQDNPMQEWTRNAVEGKLNSMWGRFQSHWAPILLADNSVNAISGSKVDFVNQVTSRSDYKDRYTIMSGSGF